MLTKVKDSACGLFVIPKPPSGVGERKIILDNIPAAQYHAGCRLRFGPDGKLYVTTGDATERALAQRLDSLAGKTLRLNDDGTVPQDNPFVGRANARPEIWSFGHRNAQGLDFQPETNLMFQTEHGPSGFDGPGGGDEVNIVEKGKDYGWPAIHHRESRAGMESPLLEYTPACAPGGGAFYRGSVFPQFTGKLLFRLLEGYAFNSRGVGRAASGLAREFVGREVWPDSRSSRRTRRPSLFFNFKPRPARHPGKRR